MPRMVKCARLGQELPGVAYKPFNNELGQRIYDHVSQQAWMKWIEYSKRIVNEFRLDLTSAVGQQVLLERPSSSSSAREAATRPSSWQPES